VTSRRIAVPFTGYQVELKRGAAAAAGPSNINSVERLASVLIGGALAVWGLWRAYPGLALLLIGGGLIYRGISGHSEVYRLLEIDTSRLNIGPRSGEAERVRVADKPLLADPVDDTVDDSFPASDPPAFNA
jgi:hypothetical protein